MTMKIEEYKDRVDDSITAYILSEEYVPAKERC